MNSSRVLLLVTGAAITLSFIGNAGSDRVRLPLGDSAVDAATISISSSLGALGLKPFPDNRMCHSVPPPGRTWEEARQNPPIGVGIGHFINETNITDAVVIGAETYRVPDSVPITVDVHILYVNVDSDEAVLPVSYIVLLNETQIDLSEDILSSTRDFLLEAGNDETLRVQLPPLEAGIHDLIVRGVLQSDLSDVGSAVTFGMRISLVVGDDPVPATQDFELLQPHPASRWERGVFNLGLHLDETQLMWAYPNVYASLSGLSPYYISVGYGENTDRLRESQIEPVPSFFAVTAFVAGQQVSITPDTHVFYGAVEPRTAYSFIPALIPEELPAGRSELLVVRINYPRIPMCWLIDNGTGYYFDPGPYARRVGIESTGQR